MPRLNRKRLPAKGKIELHPRARSTGKLLLQYLLSQADDEDLHKVIVLTCPAPPNDRWELNWSSMTVGEVAMAARFLDARLNVMVLDEGEVPGFEEGPNGSGRAS